MRRWRATAAGACALAVTAMASGCGGSTREDAATRTAVAFVAAATSGDGAAACAALTPDARRAVESFGRQCPSTIAGLRDAGRPIAAEVWGDSAQVRFTSDVVFLSEFDAGWKVRAAGCRPRQDLPYDCQVEG